MIARAAGLCLGTVAGILAATAGAGLARPAAVAAMAAGAALSAALWRQQRHGRGPSMLMAGLAAALLGLPAGHWRARARLAEADKVALHRLAAPARPGDTIRLMGRVASEPLRVRADRGDLRLRLEAVRRPADAAWRPVPAAEILVRVYAPRHAGELSTAALDKLMRPAVYGYRLRVETRLPSARPRLNPGDFDPGFFRLQQALAGEVSCSADAVTPIERSRGNPLMELALAVKQRFVDTYRATIRAPVSRLAAAATLGMRHALNGVTYRGRDIVATLRHAGVGHVLAVSGLHVSVVALMLYALLRLSGLRPRIFTPVLVLLLVLFALLTGARPSSLRAVVMNAVILIAWVYCDYGLRRAAVVGLSLSALGILAVNPLLLYSAGFLLSFGAVLSLMALTHWVDDWICLLRGWSLALAGLWLAASLSLAGGSMRTVLRPATLGGMAGALWLAVLLGARLNDRWPRCWCVSLGRLPRSWHLFLSAQLAIQLGMIVPLSAWFFGRLPLAGVLVNLAAIPLVGVFVQLGLLTGLAGLLPLAGPWLARPFGAATTLVGNIFLFLADAGARLFAFPATPRPGPASMLLYYGALGLCLWALRPARLQLLAYRWRARRAGRFVLPALRAWLPAASLALLPLAELAPRRDPVRRLTLLAADRYPLVCLVSDRGRTAVINAGDAYTGRRVLFEALRRQGAVAVDHALLAAPHPEAGLDGLAALAGSMPIGRAYLAVVPSAAQTYLSAVGDGYLREQAGRGRAWAARYETSYRKLRAVLGQRTEVAALEPGPVLAWPDLRVTALPRPGRMPERFVSSARSVLTQVELGRFRCLVVTDAVLASFDAVSALPPYDLLVLPDPASRRAWEPLLTRAVEAARPRVVVLAGRRPPSRFDIGAWAREHGPLIRLHTAADGAVTAELDRDGALVLRCYAGGRVFRLEPDPDTPAPPRPL